MANVYKLVFAGPVGAGKTTAIQSLSDIEVVRTEANATDEVRLLKQTTTVAMDYGRMNLPNGDQVRLFGTPGQKRFDFMWDILTENALGLVLMLNAASPDPVDDLRSYVNAFRSFIDSTALVVGLTHVENGSWDTRQRLARELDQMGLSASVMDTDARSRAHMSALVKALIYGIDPFTGVES
ncbi:MULTISPECIES: GTP-binding protein [Ottowia]|jgi:UPI00006A2C49 related cluster|uniref:ATP/GTP-binding protein n=1 Tax=Ottowia cancrivicina TaxID=3040346 RepID=A0AAW6RDC6_9BURK|nr:MULTISPECIES: ATP/GTP-binding protein [Ottowia]AKU67517.1 ATP-binding protein [Ottowia sp. oral taxon 894]MDG9698144.1 ATP/GTP-binding protein [Ottowia sp. 10c7w1]